ncbi:hypothetical protein A2U01_0044131, partial [Trifolium medium]|nr:hypothetical protein [Trifolium medium]
SYSELSEIAEQAKRRAEVARLRDVPKLSAIAEQAKRRAEVARLRGVPKLSEISLPSNFDTSLSLLIS